MTYLAENNVYFVLRLCENQLVTRDGYAIWPIWTYPEKVEGLLIA